MSRGDVDATTELTGERSPLGLAGVTAEDLEAYKANFATHRVGISVEETVNNYDKWAEKGTYEKDLAPGRYTGPEIAATTACRYFEENCRSSVKMLDVAAGTGFLGQKLLERGFTDLDALEPSSLMLKIAESKKFYKKHICDLIGNSKTSLPSDEYDGLLISGGMGEGHIPCAGLLELIRLVKPGGLIIIVMREEYLGYVKEYVNRLEPLMKHLEDEGAWTCQERTSVPNYSFGKQGKVFVYRVLLTGTLGIDVESFFLGC